MSQSSATPIINQPRTPHNLLAAAKKCLLRGQKFAMLTLVNIDGSAPYPLGSQMLVMASGAYLGQITGGCAETALAEHARQAMHAGTNQTHRYGVGSPFFDIQLPCGSGIDVHIDVVEASHQYVELADKIEQREVAKIEYQTALGSYQKVYLPNQRLWLFGQGPIFLSLAKLALETGFEVVAIAQHDASLELLQSAGISASKLTLKEPYWDIVDRYLDGYCAAVSLFHEHHQEAEIFRRLLTTKAFYLGALGSRRTHQRRTDELIAGGVSPAAVERIRGPVGIDIGAQTPAQIAISVLAQIISEMPK